MLRQFLVGNASVTASAAHQLKQATWRWQTIHVNLMHPLWRESLMYHGTIAAHIYAVTAGYTPASIQHLYITASHLLVQHKRRAFHAAFATACAPFLIYSYIIHIAKLHKFPEKNYSFSQ
jgi:hypothetical protein